jgi:hypothetical protein
VVLLYDDDEEEEEEVEVEVDDVLSVAKSECNALATALAIDTGI